MRIKQLLLSLFMLLSFAAATSAQVVRDLAAPVAVTEPLSDPQDATRLFYLTLANMPQSNLVVTLKKAGLSNSEVTSVRVAAAAFKTAHDANASAFLASAMRVTNSASELASYTDQDNALVQQTTTNIASLSPLSLKALNTLAGYSHTGVQKFFLEASSAMPISASNRAHLINASITCPKGSGGPYQIYDIGVSLSTALSLSSSNGTNYTFTSVGSGTYTVTYQNAYTCKEAPADVFHIKQVGTMNGAPSFNGSGATETDFCGHPGSGSFNLYAVTNAVNFTNPQDVTGTVDWQIIDVVAGVTEIMADTTEYIAGFYEHTKTTSNNAQCPGPSCVAYESPLCYPAQHSLNVVAITVVDNTPTPLTIPAPVYDNFGVGFRFQNSGPWYFVPLAVVAIISTNINSVACTYRP
jgi:hypothetical protein